MAGHSKWSSIKHKKAVIDARRGKMFTRIIRELTIAAKLGGGDVTANPRLRTAVAAAKDANMPGKNIENAIKKGTGEIEGVEYEEMVYEGYGPGGVAVMVECTSDNRNRTAAEIRHIFSKANGNLGAVGSVSYLFEKKGQIHVEGEGADEDKLMEVALEAGAEDIQKEEDHFLVVTSPNVFNDVREAIEQAEFKIANAEIANIPSLTKQVEGKDAEQVLKMMNALEEHDDVGNVSSNYDISDELIEQFQ